ncbi:toxin secretion, membrane fusion protein [Pseudoalteromonas rubra]|uniref:Toxin secretion, membrane fusion protein n=1 Tax=Pseudoalteromonas rubra TaxID=43658 RepID=A0A5S3WHW3_9GAMM|nr:HlyD family efflux transporter periplasmic adaptor subunit [Pseudoalteromonas rubra]TMP26583.1 toxin secretion, membrane fusion protein [Pseudoalteromonas rubra]TMP35791.1 toxin secretion, membrane fusion protein [Pseudoalteromonas rubra]
MSGLFRKEAIEHQGQKLDGEVSIATHMSFNWILLVILATVLIGITYLVVGEYHRKEIVSGYLRPTDGLSKVYPLGQGVIDEVYVEEGQKVEKGQVLVRVRMERILTSGSDMNEAILAELIKQKDLVKKNIENQTQLAKVSQEKLDSQINNTAFQLAQTKKQHELLTQRVELSEKRYRDTLALIEKDFVSQSDVESVRDAMLVLQQQAEDLEGRVLSQQESLSQLRLERQQLPLTLQKTEAQLRTQLADINQQITQASAQQSYDVRSHRSGRVSSLMVKPGMIAQSTSPLMTVLPENAALEAVLLVPSRAFGFVQEGQNTRIRYQAFPYARFGIYEGTISSVSKSILLPNETSLPVTLAEPAYQVVVSLKAQHAHAYGASVPLQAGMLLEADIMVDKRTLFEWLFEPLYSIKGAI